MRKPRTSNKMKIPATENKGAADFRQVVLVKVGGKRVQLRPMDDRCAQLLRSLSDATPSEYPGTLYSIVGLCLPELSEDEVQSLTLDQAIAVQQQLVKQMASAIPVPAPANPARRKQSRKLKRPLQE